MESLSEIAGYESALMVVGPKVLQQTINDVIEIIQKKPVIYVALTRPHNIVAEALKYAKIRTGNIFFVDCVTEFAGGKVNGAKNVLFIRDPADLTGIGIGIERFMKTIPKEKYVVIDALRVLMIYNDGYVVLRFVREVIENAAKNNAKAIIFTTMGKNKDLIMKASQFFEKIVGF